MLLFEQEICGRKLQSSVAFYLVQTNKQNVNFNLLFEQLFIDENFFQGTNKVPKKVSYSTSKVNKGKLKGCGKYLYHILVTELDGNLYFDGHQ